MKQEQQELLRAVKTKIRSGDHAKRAVVFQRLAAREGDPRERERLLALAQHAAGQAKLYRMVERRGTSKPLRP